MYKKISFVGGGRITRILLQGLKRKNALPEKVIVCDPDTSMHGNLKDLSIHRWVKIPHPLPQEDLLVPSTR